MCLMIWSKKHDNCINCGTNKIKHYAHGLCKNCYTKNYYKKYNEKIDKILGTSCYICGSKIKPEKHNKKIENHSAAKSNYIENPDDFVLLCHRCHHVIHWMNDKLGLGWEQILIFINRSNL